LPIDLNEKDKIWLMERQVESYLAWIGLWLVCLLGNVTILTELALRDSAPLPLKPTLVISLLYVSLIVGMVFSAYYVTFNVIRQHIIIVNSLSEENQKLKMHILKNRSALSRFFVSNDGIPCKPNFAFLAILHFVVFLPLFFIVI
jgi:hypothetical protein